MFSRRYDPNCKYLLSFIVHLLQEEIIKSLVSKNNFSECFTFLRKKMLVRNGKLKNKLKEKVKC